MTQRQCSRHRGPSCELEVCQHSHGPPGQYLIQKLSKVTECYASGPDAARNPQSDSCPPPAQGVHARDDANALQEFADDEAGCTASGRAELRKASALEEALCVNHLVIHLEGAVDANHRVKHVGIVHRAASTVPSKPQAHPAKGT